MIKPFPFSVCIGVAVFVLLLATAPMLPMAWDEGNAIYRAAAIEAWFAEVGDTGRRAFSEEAIARHWRYTVEIEGHPDLYGVAIAVGLYLGGPWLAPLTAARLGPMILFAVAAGVMFNRLAKRYSFAAAAAGVVALITMPRLFAHAHFASFDGPLTSCWILAWAAFAPASGAMAHEALAAKAPAVRLRMGLVWGIVLGAAMSCKFTGWLAPLPFLAVALIYGDRRLAGAVALGLLTAILTFWFVNPRLWHHPFAGLAKFFDLNLNRAGTALDIPTLFFGTRYTQTTGLPWYNTLVWTGITVPVGTLVLAAIGIASVLRRWATDREGVLILINWLVLVVARALPGAPVHDAERLILPSFAFLAALAGIGCQRVFACARTGQNTTEHVLYRSRIAAVMLALAGSASSLFWYAPQWLSYYNLLIGGLRGADAAGMEATYYWDALDCDVLDWLHAHTEAHDKIDFAAPSFENLSLMRQAGILRRGWRPDEPGAYRWRVIQRRPTFWTSRDRWLVEHETPVFSKTIRPPDCGIGPWRLDVPLIVVYSFEQYRRAQTETLPQPSNVRSTGQSRQ